MKSFMAAGVFLETFQYFKKDMPAGSENFLTEVTRRLAPCSLPCSAHSEHHSGHSIAAVRALKSNQLATPGQKGTGFRPKTRQLTAPTPQTLAFPREPTRLRAARS